MQDNNSDLQACLSVQPRRRYSAPNRKTRQLASELLSMVNDDRERAMAIIQEIMYYNRDRSPDWYYEKAIEKLNRFHFTYKQT